MPTSTPTNPAQAVPAWQRRHRAHAGLSTLANEIKQAADALAGTLFQFYIPPAVVLRTDRELRHLLAGLQAISVELAVTGEDD